MKTYNIKCHCKRKINKKSRLTATLLAEVPYNCYRTDLHASNSESKSFCSFNEIRQKFLLLTLSHRLKDGILFIRDVVFSYRRPNKDMRHKCHNL